MVYFFALAISTLAVLFEEMSYQQYTSGKDLAKLLAIAFIEPLIYHPCTVYWAIRGNIDILTGKKAWGKMTRKGFNVNTKTVVDGY